MWHEIQARLLRDEIEAVLAFVPDASGLSGLVREPLSQTGRGLAREVSPTQPWPLLPLIVCEAVSGNYEKALPAAAARQFLIAAAEVFDDIEDADYAASLAARYGPAVTINVATALIMLAEQAIARLEKKGVSGNNILRILEASSLFSIKACAGQHLDLSLNFKEVLSEDLYFKIAGMKSAPQVEFACYTGALLAGASQVLINRFSEFGYHLGMVSQIANDIQGITEGNDIAKRKVSLPIIYALTQTNIEARNRFVRLYNTLSESTTDITRIRDLLFHSGAIHYTMIKMEQYKQQAMDILSDIESEAVNTERLKLFLE